MARFLKFKKIISFLVVLFILTSSFLAPFEFSSKEGSFGLEKIDLVAMAVNCPDGTTADTTDKCTAYDCGDGSRSPSCYNGGGEGPMNTTQTQVPSSIGGYKGVVCGTGMISGDLGGCFAIASYGIFTVSSVLLEVAGKIFNGMLNYALSNSTMNQPFVKKAWSSTRDMANMLFILLLVVISISIILDLGKYKSKELILNVIIIALLINFSLFISRVVIDAGNIVALGFYNSLENVNDVDASQSIINTGTPEKDISAKFMESFKAEKMISPSLFDKWSGQFNKGEDGSSFVANMILGLVFLMTSAIILYAAYIFLSAGFLFVIRVAWLWILMALAPLAFISYVIPQLKAKGWDAWWDKLISKSFCIVVFMFWMWLVLIIVGDGFLEGAFSSPLEITDFAGFLVTVLMQFMVVAVLLGMSLSSTKKLCDDGGIGSKVMGLAKGAAMLGVGAATGGTALLARQGLGALATKRIATLEASGAGTTTSGKLQLKALKSVESAKFGRKEGYKQRKDRIAKEEEKYIRDIPEYSEKQPDGTIKKYDKKDVANQYIQNKTKPVIDEEGKEVRKASTLMLLMGRAAGVEKGIKDYQGREEKKQGLGGLRAETAIAKAKMEDAREKMKGEMIDEINEYGEAIKKKKTPEKKEELEKEYKEAFAAHEESKDKTQESKEKTKFTEPKDDSKKDKK